MILKLKHIIFYLYLRFKHKEKYTNPTSLQKAENIGILFYAGNNKQNEIISKFSNYLQTQHKVVQLLGYIPKQEIGSQYTFPIISDKETTWYGKPKVNISQQIAHTAFDLIINFSIDDYLPLEYIFADTNAKFRVGFSTEKNNANYDLILIPKENHDISTLISNLEKYLK